MVFPAERQASHHASVLTHKQWRASSLGGRKLLWPALLLWPVLLVVGLSVGLELDDVGGDHLLAAERALVEY